MSKLGLSVDEVLTTTRAVRKRLDFDRPVDFSLIRECLELAVQSPTGSAGQFWHFVMVDDPDKRKALGDLYAKAWPIYAEQPFSIYNLHANDPEMKPIAARAADSAAYLGENMGRAPWLMVPVLNGRYEGATADLAAGLYGSILPAVWSFMLAARERALGTCWTTIHLMFEREAADILGIPYEEYTQVALVPIAYTKGTDFKPAPRKDLDLFIHRNGW
ncbi:MAG: nitroreductase family protein [Gammaproteobacteria bacterium]|nr:nitroreductase family protein [Gammaproteobacteria bacterium]MCP5201345.1 nitroreductase family protein [Gammaproteobacteria bacterium]